MDPSQELVDRIKKLTLTSPDSSSTAAAEKKPDVGSDKENIFGGRKEYTRSNSTVLREKDVFENSKYNTEKDNYNSYKVAGCNADVSSFAVSQPTSTPTPKVLAERKSTCLISFSPSPVGGDTDLAQNATFVVSDQSDVEEFLTAEGFYIEEEQTQKTNRLPKNKSLLLFDPLYLQTDSDNASAESSGISFINKPLVNLQSTEEENKDSSSSIEVLSETFDEFATKSVDKEINSFNDTIGENQNAVIELSSILHDAKNDELNECTNLTTSLDASSLVFPEDEFICDNQEERDKSRDKTLTFDADLSSHHQSDFGLSQLNDISKLDNESVSDSKNNDTELDEVLLDNSLSGADKIRVSDVSEFNEICSQASVCLSEETFPDVQTCEDLFDTENLNLPSTSGLEKSRSDNLGEACQEEVIPPANADEVTPALEVLESEELSILTINSESSESTIHQDQAVQSNENKTSDEGIKDSTENISSEGNDSSSESQSAEEHELEASPLVLLKNIRNLELNRRSSQSFQREILREPSEECIEVSNENSFAFEGRPDIVSFAARAFDYLSTSFDTTEQQAEYLDLLDQPSTADNKYSQFDSVPSSFRPQMIAMAEGFDKLQQENSQLKIELNASKQAQASFELEIGKKDEIILKTEAESLKKEQSFQQELKLLREQIKEQSNLIEKGASRNLEEALKEAKAREAQALVELNAKINDENNYRKIMEEYEKTISARTADSQRLKKEIETSNRHLSNLELSFSDVHQKYERAKHIIEGFKNNEDILRKKVAVCEEVLQKQEEKYESLKAHASAQIDKSNKEICQMRERFETELSKQNAIIRRLEIKTAALETSLEQKTQECQALAALCDEVTGKKV